MRVLLVKPSNLGDHIQPSLGLGYLATAIREYHDVMIVDCLKEKHAAPQLLPVLEDFQPDVVGMQCYSFDVPTLKPFLQACKDYSRDVRTIIGGPHPTALPAETLQYFGEVLDFVFAGEGELGFPRFLQQLEHGEKARWEEVPGLVWRDAGLETVRVNQRAESKDLDVLGLPAWDLMQPELYPENQHGMFYRQFPIAPIMATRGCPYLCTFCSSAATKLRRRSPDHFINEVELLYHEFGIREFHVVDDNFTLDMRYAKALLRSLIDLDLDVSWCTPNGVRLDRLDEECLDLMKQAGFYSVSVGIESGSDRILQRMKKGTTTEKIRRGIEMVNRSGIDVVGFFILGFPGETIDEIKQTLRFSRELGLKRATFFTYLPLPGTESWRELEANGHIDQIDWDNYFYWGGAYTDGTISRSQLKWYLRMAFFGFYLRPRAMAGVLKEIQSFRHMKMLWGYLAHRLAW